MRVELDDQIYHVQRRGGASRYFFELTRALEDLDDDLDVDQGIRWTTNEYLLAAGVGEQPPPLLRQPATMALRNNVRRRSRADVVHHTYYAAAYLHLYRRPRRRVVSVLDMIPERFPELFSTNPHRAKRRYVELADHVLCISEATRRDVLTFYGSHLDERITVSPLAVGNEFHPGVAVPSGLPDRYVLYVGKRTGYKDFHVLVDAFARSSRAADFQLLAAGGGPFDARETRLLEERNLRHRVRQMDVPDHALPGMYAGARCFVFPSRYEGFGLPTLEAMACGTPCILADTSSLPEVGGAAALYFAPGDAAELSDLLDLVCSDDRAAGDLRTSGLARATEFSWRRTAQLTLDAYRGARFL